MATKRQNYLITTAEDIDVNDIASDKVGALITGSTVKDSVNVMASSHIPHEEEVLVSPEFKIIQAKLTATEAKKLAQETGVKNVELDEKVYAYEESDTLLMEPGLQDNASSRFFEELYQPNVGVGSEISADLDADAESYQYDLSDEELAKLAEQELHKAPMDDASIEFDLNGQIVNLDQQLDKVAAGLAKAKKVSHASARQLIDALAKELQSDIRGDMTPDALESKISRVVTDYISEDDEADALASDYISYGLKIIFAPIAWNYAQGAGVRVAVVDTGISNRHPDLRVYGGASFVEGHTSWVDDHGHGTHVAGTIGALMNNSGVVGVAPQCQLFAIKVLNRQGSGYTSWILNGLMACYRAGMHVVNLSLGSGATTHDRNTYSAAYERAGQMLLSRSILPIAAAGNSGRTSSPYVGNPARCPSFMAVSAVDSNRRRPDFSSYGPQVEIAGPGVSVWSTTVDGRYGQMSGTSMATPHVAGVAALAKSRRPYMHASQIRSLMKGTATDLGSHGPDPFYGFGLVNAYNAVR